MISSLLLLLVSTQWLCLSPTFVLVGTVDFSGTLVWSPLVPESSDNWEVLFSRSSLTHFSVSGFSYGYTNFNLNPARPLSLFFLLIVFSWPKIQVAAASKHERLDAFSRFMDSLKVFPTWLNVTSWKLVFVQQTSSVKCTLEAFSVHKNVIAIFFLQYIHCVTFKAVAPVKLFGFFFATFLGYKNRVVAVDPLALISTSPLKRTFCAFVLS